MKKSFLIFIIFILFGVSLTTFFLVLNYVDPFENTFLALFSFMLSYTLFVSSFFCLVLYFFKNIYFRGNVYVYNILSSFRQWFLISVFFACVTYFIHIWAPMILSSILVFISLFFLELFIENHEK